MRPAAAPRERDERTPSKCSGQPRHQHEGVRLDEHAGGDGGSSREPSAALRGDHRANQQQPHRQIELSERQLLDEELAGEENREPHQHCDDSRRSGRAKSDNRTNAKAMAAVSVNQATSATSFDTHVKGTMSCANAGKYLYW